MDFWIKAAQLILSLSILVFLHELGHFIPARLFKTRVEKFYLFFNPWFSLVKKKIGETEWGIGWVPLGGYVKIAGMIDESMDKEQMAKPAQPWEFRSKPAWQRLIIMIGGVTVNIIVGIFIYIFVVFAWGEEQVPTKNLSNGLSIHPYMQKYDLHSGDNVLAINGNEVMHINDINNGILIRDQYELKVKRENGTIETVTIPDGAEYDMFKEGAMRAFDLRFESTPVKALYATRGLEDVQTSKEGNLSLNVQDFLYTVDGKTIDQYENLRTFRDGAKDVDVAIIRNGFDEKLADTISLKVPGAKAKAFFQSFPAATAGIRKGDIIEKIGDREIVFFDQIVEELYNNKNKSVLLTIQRGEEIIKSWVPVNSKGTIGFSREEIGPKDIDQVKTVYYGFGESIGRGFSKGMTTLTDYIGQLKFLFTKKGASSIGGFGSIGKMFSATWDWHSFWLNTALISIILAFMNILPIPALDGGHVVFLLYEMITGREAPQKVLEVAQMVGFIILVGLLLYANGNDIIRAISGS